MSAASTPADAPPPFRHVNWMPRHIAVQRRGAQGEWLKLGYAEAQRKVDSLSQALLDLKLTAERQVVIRSGNSIEHALLTLAAMQVGVPAAPVSPAYSLLSQDHARLRTIFDLIRPGLVLVQDGELFAKALAALDLRGVTLVHAARPCPGLASRAFDELAATAPTGAVAAALAALTPDTVGKLLFTSGSAGMPKAVINTQRMMCANLAMARQARPRRADDAPPVILDWMPWTHTMGGNASFNQLLADGGTLYIDEGKPVPGAFDTTLRNLREVSPTCFSNVPAGYAMLATALEHDDDLARAFFKNLGLLAYGGATLSDDLYRRMQALAVRHTGQRIVFFTGWGATETAPTATATYWDTERVGLIGLPYAGVELKLVPTGSKCELRPRGPIVTPGYYRQPELTKTAFDEEGFYKIGDAATFVDADDPTQGLVFAGRVAEDFKLASGTFVRVGPLRVAATAAASPGFQDALVAGQDRDFVALLAWPNLEACRQLGARADAGPSGLIGDAAVRQRAALVQRLYAQVPDDAVIEID